MYVFITVFFYFFQFLCEPNIDCIKEETLPGLQVVSLLLPGVPVTKSGSELGIINNSIMPWENTTNGGFTTAATTWRSVNSDFVDRNVASQLADENSQLNLYKRLVQDRQNSAILYGNTNVLVLSDTVFTFTR